MGRKPNVYTKVEEAVEMVAKLCEKQPSVLWAVRPETIAVMGIENKERSKKNHTLAKIKAVKGCEKAIFQLNNIATRYVIEIYWSDWNLWSQKEKAAILFHELLHVHSDFERVVKHDCEDFRIILDKLGVDWAKKGEGLPNLLEDDVKFNIELLPSMGDEEDPDPDPESEDDIEDSDKKAKNKKARERSKEDETGIEDLPEEIKDEDEDEDGETKE